MKQTNKKIAYAKHTKQLHTSIRLCLNHSKIMFLELIPF